MFRWWNLSLLHGLVRKSPVKPAKLWWSWVKNQYPSLEKFRDSHLTASSNRIENYPLISFYSTFWQTEIRYAILNESWYLVQEGILSVADVDTVMSQGLGPRYAFMGPLETAHLNAEGMIVFSTGGSYWSVLLIVVFLGMENYCERYGETIFKVSKTLGPVTRFDGSSLENVNRQLTEQIPLEKLQEKRAWRNVCLASLAKLKKDINKEVKN